MLFDDLGYWELELLADEIEMAVGKYATLLIIDPFNYNRDFHTELYDIYRELRIMQLRRAAKKYNVTTRTA